MIECVRCGSKIAALRCQCPDGLAVINADCRVVAADLGGLAAIVTDPPYGLGFMGRGWAFAVPGVELWELFLGACLPGAHLAACGGTRLYHRMAAAIDDAGWEVRDCLMWRYGSGFPKSLDVSKAIDKAAGVHVPLCKAFNVAGGLKSNGGSKFRSDHPEYERRTPAPAAAKRWNGWGTALKPAWEPITLARKPLAGTVAANVLQHGTGGINVDGGRVGDDERFNPSAGINKIYNQISGGKTFGRETFGRDTLGRWPANLALDESAAAQLDKQQPGVSRFFYTAKANGTDRGNKPEKKLPLFGESVPEIKNTHPTVKPTDLMQWLLALIVPPGAVVFDPFCGSGTTLVAARSLGMPAIGAEISPEYCDIIKQRLDA